MVAGISDHFYETMSFVGSNGATVTSEAVAANQDIFLAVFLNGLVFCQTNHSDFWMGVNRCWCEVQLSLVVVTIDGIFSSHFTHTVSSMSQHLGTVDITRCVDTWDRSFLVFVHLDTTAVQFKVEVLKTCQLWHTTDGKKGFFRNDFWAVIQLDGQLVVGFHDFRYTNRGQEFHPLLRKDFLQFNWHFAVHTWDDTVRHFNNRYFRSIRCVNETEFDTDNATTHNCEGFRNFTQVKDIIRCQDQFGINTWDVDAWYFRTSRKDDRTTLDYLVADDNSLVRVYLTKTVKDSDFVGFQETSNTARQGLHNLVLEVNCLVHVNCVVGWSKVDTALSRNLQTVQDFRILEVGLGWDTALVQAGSAKFWFFNDSDFTAQLGTADGCIVASRTTADDNHVILVCCQFSLRSLWSCCWSCRHFQASRLQVSSCLSDTCALFNDFSFCTKVGNDFCYRNSRTIAMNNLQKDTRILCLQLHAGLVWHHFQDNIAFIDHITFLFFPLDDFTFLHVYTEFGHNNFYCHD